MMYTINELRRPLYPHIGDVNNTTWLQQELKLSTPVRIYRKHFEKKNKNIDEGHPGGLMIGSVIILLWCSSIRWSELQLESYM